MKFGPGIPGLGLAALLFACNQDQQARLQRKIDSLTVELQDSKQSELMMAEIGALIDSIDVGRWALRSKMVEGTSYNDYISRLKGINNHLKETETKIAQLEKKGKRANGISAATIRKLKSDLEARSQELLVLQVEIEKMREQNKVLANNVSQRDSTIAFRDEVIKLREQDIQQLESLVRDINEQTKIKVANLYFAQAQALETAAKRTHFAPRRKRETKREALELYKLSFALGKSEAESRIKELERDLS